MGLEVDVTGRHLLVLVTGATGAVGPSVVEAFRATGHAVRTLSANPPPAGIWPRDVEVCMGDVTDPAPVAAAMRDVDAVIHMAALLHITDPPPSLRERFDRINVGGTSTVLESAVQAGVRRVVFFSTIAVYGPSPGVVVTEETSPCPDTLYARSKLAAEKIVLEAMDSDGRQIGTVLRFGTVYGPRIKGNYRHLIRSLARGRFIPIGDGSNRRSLIYDRDAARAAVLAATHSNAAGAIFNVTDGQFHTMKAIIETLCGALGRTPPAFALPLAPARLAAGLLEGSFRLFKLQPPVTRDTVNKYAEDMAVDSTRIRSLLGFAPRYDLSAGWRETVLEMRRTGAL